MNICQVIFSYFQLSPEDVYKEVLIRRPVWLSAVTKKGLCGHRVTFWGQWGKDFILNELRERMPLTEPIRMMKYNQ